MISLRRSDAKTPGGFGKTAERETFQSEFFDAGKPAGMLKTTDGIDERVEEIEHDQGAILIEVKSAVGGRVAFAANPVEPGKQRQETFEVLESADV